MATTSILPVQHGEKCSLQFIENIDWRIKTQDPHDRIINAVPNC
ncbi:hypothetical protein MtrunA17_Chr2g0318141 [Medicago truncatula]|uniref:Uncharacterized protein n=1 Tax=Medicago truncatula TaxID=3880 RepID=A0A396JCY8_MEDTR|nr:hypothetical protein MtrunA17_Chr2g0318141 [Medicago truncatula]